MEHYKNLSLESLPNEIWKDIEKYEGQYSVSNYSRIKGERRKVVSTHKNQNRFLKSMILKQRLDSKGYLYVCLNNASKHIPKNFRVHRIFATAFIPNPENKSDINHKNGVRHDNRIQNLEWCTRSENVLHSRRVLGSKGGSSRGEDNYWSRKIICENNGKSYVSINQASLELKLHPSGVAAVCRKERNHTGGYTFRYL